MTRPDVAAAIAKWNEQTREEFEERAAIIEYDGKVDCDNAELMAYQQIMRSTRPIVHTQRPAVERAQKP